MTNRFKCNGAMEPDEYGGYVLHADYQKLVELAKDQTEFLEWLDDMGLINDGWWDTNKAKEKYDLWKEKLSDYNPRNTPT